MTHWQCKWYGIGDPFERLYIYIYIFWDALIVKLLKDIAGTRRT